MGAIYMNKTLVSLGVLLTLATTSVNAELVQQFKDPTFSGQGWASHVLTLEQMRQGAKSAQESKAAADAANAAATAANTPLAKFMSLFTGQVYSQLATQLTNNLFKECVANNPQQCSNGEFLVTETQKIIWQKAGGNVTLTVFDGTKSGNAVTWNSAYTQQVIVPISSFSF
jgi:hypothetical protein